MNYCAGHVAKWAMETHQKQLHVHVHFHVHVHVHAVSIDTYYVTLAGYTLCLPPPPSPLYSPGNLIASPLNVTKRQKT